MNRTIFEYVTLKDRPDLKEKAAGWFHEKWGVPEKSYLECMDAYLNDETPNGWYLCLDEGQIVGGLGVIDNDFHDRKDLAPNICAVYVEERYRRQGIAKALLTKVMQEAKEYGCGVVQITPSDMGMLLYTDFGFVKHEKFMQYQF